MNILLDAMGGDNASGAVIEGAVAALEKENGFTLTLVGDAGKIEAELKGYPYDKSRVEIIHASEVIDMNDVPTVAIKKKKDSSMVVGLNMLAEDKADIMISAGNTGALMAGATLIVRRLSGVKRPPIATQLPSKTGSVLLLDCGANADCKPEYLSQFALMGSVYMERVAGVNNPRVALLNNGTEEHKGNMLTKEAYSLLCDSGLNFIGNTEGSEVLSGGCDVVVADGFTGNILLKNIEGMASLIMSELKENIMASSKAKFGAVFMKDAFKGLKKKFDYSEYGGSLLLGLNKGVIKAHGKSDAKAFANAIAVAKKIADEKIVENIRNGIQAAHEH